MVGRISPSRHFDGAAALIKQRRKGHMTDLSKRLLIAIRSNIVRSTTYYNCAWTDRLQTFRAMQFSSPIEGTSDVLDAEDESPQSPGTLLDLMSVDVANLLALADQTLRRDAELKCDKIKSSTATLDLLMKAQEVDANLATWPLFVPQDWIPMQVAADNVPKSVVDAGFYGNSCAIYPDIMICSTWNEWRVARLMVLGLIARIDHKESKDQAVTAIQELVDGICASVPFSLGDRTQPGNMYGSRVEYPSLPGKPMSKAHQTTASAYGGWYLFAPLQETIKIAMHLRSGQRDWLYGQLMRLAKMYDVVTSPLKFSSK